MTVLRSSFPTPLANAIAVGCCTMLSVTSRLPSAAVIAMRPQMLCKSCRFALALVSATPPVPGAAEQWRSTTLPTLPLTAMLPPESTSPSRRSSAMVLFRTSSTFRASAGFDDARRLLVRGLHDQAAREAAVVDEERFVVGGRVDDLDHDRLGGTVGRRVDRRLQRGVVGIARLRDGQTALARSARA